VDLAAIDVGAVSLGRFDRTDIDPVQLVIIFGMPLWQTMYLLYMSTCGTAFGMPLGRPCVLDLFHTSDSSQI
jgi:hypothetical protein